MSSATSALATRMLGSQTVADTTANKFAAFYGEPEYISRDMIPAEGRRTTAAYDLPEAYRTKNLYIPALIEELVITTDNWYTKVACPIQVTDQLSYAMNTTTYDQHLPRRTPYKAPSRILESKRSQVNGKLVRKGLMYIMESNFMDTPEGQLHYFYTLNQMANAIIASLNIGVIQAYFNAHNRGRVEEEANGIRSTASIMAKMREEISNWAIVQTQTNGLRKLDVSVSAKMEGIKGKANMWIFPPGLKAYNDLQPPENVNYFIAGARASQHLDDASKPFSTLNGSRVYICRVFDDVLQGGVPNLLAREREIGSYYALYDKYKDADDAYWRNYKTSNRSIRVYDEGDDDWRMIGLSEALDNAYAFDRDGNVFLPPNNRTLSDGRSGLEDREDDMLSYVDEGDGQRKAVSLFGHLKEEHFSVPSAVNLSKTIVNLLAKTTGAHSVGEMEGIITDGVRLAQKMGEQEVTQSWLFNLLVEHAIAVGAPLPELTDPKDLGSGIKDGSISAFVAAITRASKRSSVPMRVIIGEGGNGMRLPKLDYASVVAVSNAGGGNGATINTLADLASAADAPPGGTTRGSLAGFGNWDGMLALQAELLSGPGISAGFTRGGYPISDCEVANRFVNLVKNIASTSQFLLENRFYLNKNRASSTVENPSVEHVIAEKLLGLHGFAVFLDASGIRSIVKPVDDEENDANVALGTRAKDFMISGDESNVRVIAAIKQALKDIAKVEPGAKDDVSDLIKKLDFFFTPFVGNVSDNGSSLFTYDDTSSSTLGKMTQGLFPLANLSPGSSLPSDWAMRREILDIIVSQIMNNENFSDGDKVQLLKGFLADIAKATGLGPVITSMTAEQAQTLADRAVRLPLDSAGDRVTALDGLGGWSYAAKSHHRMSLQTFARIVESLANRIKERSPDAVSVAQKSVEAVQEEMRLQSERTARDGTKLSPVLRSMGIYADTPQAVPALAASGASGMSATRKRGARGYNVAGRMGEDHEEEFLRNIDVDAEVESPFAFFRTPLVLTAKQVEKLGSIANTDRIKFSLAKVRVGDPENQDRMVEPGRMGALVDKIKSVNKNGSNKFGERDVTNYRSQPSIMFYPENARMRDMALASMPSNLNNMRGSSNDSSSKRKAARAAGGGGSKRRRTGASSVNLDDAYGAEDDYGSGHRKRKGGGRSSSSYSTGRGGAGDDYYGGGGGADSESDSSDSNGRDYDDYDNTSVYSLKRQMGVDDDNDGDGSEGITPNVVKLLIKVGDASYSNLIKIFGKIYYTSSINERTLRKFLDNGVLFPFGFLIFQPHKRYISYAAIKAWAGEETGRTLIAHSGLMLENNAVDKTHIGHFTTHDDTVITNPKNVYVAYDVYVAGTLGGADFRPIDPSRYDPLEGKSEGSVAYVLIPYEEVKHDPILDITGRFAVSTNLSFTDQERANAKGYSQNWRARQIFGFRPMYEGTPYDSQSQAPMSNTVVARGQQFNYSDATGDYTSKVTSLGHWSKEGPGSKGARQGGWADMAGNDDDCVKLRL